MIGETNPREDARCEKLLAKLAPNWMDTLRDADSMLFTLGQIYGRKKPMRKTKVMSAKSGA